jgi:hypothetical protein
MEDGRGNKIFRIKIMDKEALLVSYTLDKTETFLCLGNLDYLL